jgi:hypothetical protein
MRERKEGRKEGRKKETNEKDKVMFREREKCVVSRTCGMPQGR